MNNKPQIKQKIQSNWKLYAPLNMVGIKKREELIHALYELGFQWKGDPLPVSFDYSGDWLLGNFREAGVLVHTTHDKLNLAYHHTRITMKEVFQALKESKMKTLEQKLNNPFQIKVKCQEISEIVQHALFKMGCTWQGLKKFEILPNSLSWIRVNQDEFAMMTHTGNISDDLPELSIKEVLDGAYVNYIQIKNNEKISREVIQVGDIFFYKDDFENAIKNLKKFTGKMFPQYWFVDSINKDIAILIQKHFFNAGGEWYDVGKRILSEHWYRHIGIEPDYQGLVWGNEPHVPECNKLSIEEFFQYDTCYAETIEIGGNVYFKKDFEKATEDLEQVKWNRKK